jgi:16S rRNA processing protein RimM
VPAVSSERLVVGLVRGVHGLRGDVKVEVLTDRPAERFAVGAVLHREGSTEPLTIAAATPIADAPGWRLRFRELPDRTSAEWLRDAYLETGGAPASLERGAYWWHEVIGCAVTDVSGLGLGTVADVYRAGGAEVFVVRGGRVGEFDVPAVRAFIRVFAPRRGEIVVDAAALDLDLPRAEATRAPETPVPASRPEANGPEPPG